MALCPEAPKYNNAVQILNTDSYSQEIESFLNEEKIKQIFETLPPTTKTDMWGSYEMRETQFWGLAPYNPSPIPGKLIKNNKYGFLTVHDDIEYSIMSQMVPNAIVIELVNDVAPYTLSKFFKNTVEYESCTHYDIPATLDHSIKFNIGSLFDQRKFFLNVKKLLNQFPIIDKTLDKRVYSFYNRYMEYYKQHI